jgi:hypothetical protein
MERGKGGGLAWVTNYSLLAGPFLGPAVTLVYYQSPPSLILSSFFILLPPILNTEIVWIAAHSGWRTALLSNYNKMMRHLKPSLALTLISSVLLLLLLLLCAHRRKISCLNSLAVGSSSIITNQSLLDFVGLRYRFLSPISLLSDWRRRYRRFSFSVPPCGFVL